MTHNLRMSAWRAVCRQAMQSAAEAEARAAWQRGPDENIPFNYRWEHVQQVVATANWLGRVVNADGEIVEAAAWLHDVRKTTPHHAQAGAEAALGILAATDFPAEKIEQVCTVIAQHEGLTRGEDAPPLKPLEAAVLWDADKLTKLGVQAIIYAMSTPRTRGLTLAERLDGFRSFTRNVLSQTVMSMNTPAGRALAEQRYREMCVALDEWARDAAIGVRDAI